ncbi:MAG: sugar kinase [Bacteroidota bacterium]
MAKVTVFGEILLRLSTKESKLFNQSTDFQVDFGGSEANIAVSLSQMGVPANIASVLPDHEISNHALSVFKSYGTDVNDVRKLDSGRLGLYFLEQGAALRGSKVIYDREGSCFSKVKASDFDWDSIFDDCEWFHTSGISPAVSQSAATACIEAVSIAKSKGLKVSIDMNYRKNLWKYGKSPADVMPDIIKNTDVVLGDPATMNHMLGTQLATRDFYADAHELLDSYKQLQDNYPNLQYAAMTLRTVKSANHNIISGAIYHQGKMYGANPFNVSPIVERIGGGDAFMAGLIYGLQSKKDLDYVINYATTASALKMTISGDFNSFSKEEIERYMHAEQLGMIKR